MNNAFEQEVRAMTRTISEHAFQRWPTVGLDERSLPARKIDLVLF